MAGNCTCKTGGGTCSCEAPSACGAPGCSTASQSRLGFAMGVLNSAPSVGPYWAVRGVADLYRRSKLAAYEDDRDRDESMQVEGLIQEALETDIQQSRQWMSEDRVYHEMIPPGQEDEQRGTSSPYNDVELKKLKDMTRVDPYGNPVPPPPPLDDEEGRKGRWNTKSVGRCCVKKFLFPESWCELDRRTLIPGSKHIWRQVGVKFEVLAEFIPGTDKAGAADNLATMPTSEAMEAIKYKCDCNCCEYRQYVRDLRTEMPTGSTSSNALIEDCRYDSGTGKNSVERWRLVPAGGIPASTPGADSEGRLPARSVHCYGRRGTHGVASGKPEDRYSDRGCKFTTDDNPGFRVPEEAPAGQVYYSHLYFQGLIVDTCHFDSIKRIGSFVTRVRYTTGKPGKLSTSLGRGVLPRDPVTRIPSAGKCD